jgi:sugar phosphate isomerase/epimerase
MPTPKILLSGFADETVADKHLEQQCAIFAALGLSYFTIRFVNLGDGIKNVLALSDSEIDSIRQRMSEYGLSVSSIGSPIGKIKLLDVEDGTPTPFRPFEEYLKTEVVRVCQIAQRFETKLIRGFSFYPPKGHGSQNYIAHAIDRIGQIVDRCQREGLIFGLELEANLVGRNGYAVAEIIQQLNHPSLVSIFDGGNLVMQGMPAEEIFKQYQVMKPGLGWIHIKDCRRRKSVSTETNGYVDEDKVDCFMPADKGDAGHESILRDFSSYLPDLHRKMISKSVGGVFVDLEPHLKGGGQFGGYSGPDGFGVALRSFCALCDHCGIEYQLRSFSDLKNENA